MTTLPPPPRVLFSSIYLLSTGAITGSVMQTGGAGGATAADALHGEVSGKYDPATYYISTTGGTAAATLRPAMGASIDKTAISANGTDTATISGVPNPATLSIDGETPSAVTDGEVEFTATVAGTYTLALSAFPALDQDFTVVAS